MCYHDRNLHRGKSERFTPPSMLSFGYSSEPASRAAQEDAYIAWCEAQPTALHNRPADEAAAMAAAKFLTSFPGPCPSAAEEGAATIPQVTASDDRKVA